MYIDIRIFGAGFYEYKTEDNLNNEFELHKFNDFEKSK